MKLDIAKTDLPERDTFSRSLVLLAERNRDEVHTKQTNPYYRNPTLQDCYRSVAALAPDMLRIKIERVGVCGTDLHLFEFNDNGNLLCSSPLEIPPEGRIIGHEAVGKVTEKGSDDLPFSIGDYVCAESILTCGTCRFCRRGAFNQCVNAKLFGLERDGFFTEFVNLPAKMAHCVTDLAVSAEKIDELVCIEPAAVAFLACQNARITPGDSVAILGAGPVGMYCAQFARSLFGARRVIVSEPISFRRGLASTTCDLALTPDELADSTASFDSLIDCAGSSEDVNRLIPRMEGNGRIVLLARTNQKLSIDHVDEMITKSLTLSGSRGHLSGAIDSLLGLMRERRIDLSAPVTKHLMGFDALANVLRNPMQLVQADCKVVAQLH